MQSTMQINNMIDKKNKKQKGGKILQNNVTNNDKLYLLIPS